VTRLESLEVADPRRSYIRTLLATWWRWQIHDQGGDCHHPQFVSWNTIKDIIKTDLKRRLKRRKLNRVRRIAIDEVAVKKGTDISPRWWIWIPARLSTALRAKTPSV